MLINVNNPVEVTSFLPTLSSTLQSAGLDTQVKIACCDTIGWANAKTVTSRLLSAGMEKYLGLLTSHMYTGDPNSAITGTKLPAWMTEGADLNSRWCTTWYSNGGLCEGLTWANKVATGILSANLSGYIYWQGLEVNQGQASSYLVYVLHLFFCDFFWPVCKVLICPSAQCCPRRRECDTLRPLMGTGHVVAVHPAGSYPRWHLGVHLQRRDRRLQEHRRLCRGCLHQLGRLSPVCQGLFQRIQPLGCLSLAH